MLTPLPHQIDGAKWLAGRRRALLADEPRVGKTLATVMAADMILARRIRVVTTSSGRAVWRRAFRDLSTIPRTVGVVGVHAVESSDVEIMSWAAVKPGERTPADLTILDESHYAKNPETKRARAVYGEFDGSELNDTLALVKSGGWVWSLSGTPAPHDPGDLFCCLRSSAPELLEKRGEWPAVLSFEKFRDRYCIVRQKKISNWTRIPVVVGGRNLDELRNRIGGFMLRRTQKDIGIQPPRYDFLPLIVPAKTLREIGADADMARIVAAINAGKTKDLDMELGPLRRLTGSIKADAIIDVVKEELIGNWEKLVLMFYHNEVGEKLMAGLPEFMPVLVDGSTSPKQRDEAQRLFREDKYCRIFLGQIQAAGEAVDLSAAAMLWFVETCFTPALMGQAAQRIQNVNQTRNTYVKVACIEGSIDEAIQAALFRLWVSIKYVIG